jgi:hypothetical protein
MKGPQPFQRIIHLQQGPACVVAHAAKDFLGRGAEVDHTSGGSQAVTVRLPQHGPASGREDPVGQLHQILERALLEIPESSFPLTSEKITDRAADLLLDHVIRIPEGESEPPGELAPDGGFAGAGKPDQNQAQRSAWLRYQFAVRQSLTP